QARLGLRRWYEQRTRGKLAWLDSPSTFERHGLVTLVRCRGQRDLGRAEDFHRPAHRGGDVAERDAVQAQLLADERGVRCGQDVAGLGHVHREVWANLVAQGYAPGLGLVLVVVRGQRAGNVRWRARVLVALERDGARGFSRLVGERQGIAAE